MKVIHNFGNAQNFSVKKEIIDFVKLCVCVTAVECFSVLVLSFVCECVLFFSLSVLARFLVLVVGFPFSLWHLCVVCPIFLCVLIISIKLWIARLLKANYILFLFHFNLPWCRIATENHVNCTAIINRSFSLAEKLYQWPQLLRTTLSSLWRFAFNYFFLPCFSKRLCDVLRKS